ncbi:MAG: nucleoside phosphorylase [Deltaproteobacteria bacterium]|nr:nucleoside phosphorylase [Deltaproteobacteria bacterium]
MSEQEADTSPILTGKQTGAPSVFRPENLLREARRQKGLPLAKVPAVCVLDPDGDLEGELRRSGQATLDATWPCYHTSLSRFRLGDVELGVVARAVGAPFAVLEAEQLFASGCQLLLSVTSAGQIADLGPTPYFILIDEALRDEGTSYHYLPASRFAPADPKLADAIHDALSDLPIPVHRGASWTTDAPFRETEEAIARAAEAGVLAVEMEAAALYAFAQARKRAVLCFAHVTNQMAQSEGDFEKGEANGARDVLRLLDASVRAWRGRPTRPRLS